MNTHTRRATIFDILARHGYGLRSTGLIDLSDGSCIAHMTLVEAYEFADWLEAAPRRAPVPRPLAGVVWGALVWVVILLVALLATGCAEPLPIHVKGEPTLPPSVREACDMLGLECVSTRQEYGSIVIELELVDWRGGPAVMGEADDSVCRPSLWVDPRNPVRVAHEIGHVLGLDHVDDPDNVMAAVNPGEDLTDEQLDTVADGAWLLGGCRL